jgi:predicted ribosomally synthesized peptide with nif11-like leader
MASAEPPKNLERFCQLVLEDPQLHQQLRQPLVQDEFIALAIRLGQERGYSFTAEEVRAALNERRRAWLERWI